MFDLPPTFVYLHQTVPNIQQEVRYASSNNFVGRPIPGYAAPYCILTKAAADALAKIQKELKETYDYSLLVYDGYRPTQAVEYFVRWSKDPSDQSQKAAYYPNVDKKDLFKLNYIAEKSGHSRGSTVDLTIINNQTGQPLDMGSNFDFLDPLSHPTNRQITDIQYKNRQLLQQIMHKYGFEGIDTEWWHFTLKNEPHPDQYFNFVVKKPIISTAANEEQILSDVN